MWFPSCRGRGSPANVLPAGKNCFTGDLFPQYKCRPISLPINLIRLRAASHSPSSSLSSLVPPAMNHCQSFWGFVGFNSCLLALRSLYADVL